LHLTFVPPYAHNLILLRRAPAIILLTGFLFLGTGLLEALHLRVHLLEHANAKLLGEDPDQTEQHETHCALCYQLHLPTVNSGWVPLLVCLGLLVAFLTLLAPPLAPQRVALRVDCRGPPFL
jgi:hypothetical protein